MEDRICQSCGMTMSEKDDSVGTNFDGTLSMEYCSYCYKLGEFKDKLTFDEMVEVIVEELSGEATGWDEEETREEAIAYLNTLRRWKKKEPVIELYDNPLG